MNTADWIALASAALAAASFFAALLVYMAQRKTAQAAEIARLHELWWTEGLHKVRHDVYRFVEEWEAAGCSPTPLVRSYRDGSSEHQDKRLLVGRVAFFFADLNAMIDAGLVSERFAYRVFGNAQFFWFSPFLLACANETEVSSNRRGDRRGVVVRWVHEIRALERRFRELERRGGASGRPNPSFHRTAFGSR